MILVAIWIAKVTFFFLVGIMFLDLIMHILDENFGNRK